MASSGPRLRRQGMPSPYGAARLSERVGKMTDNEMAEFLSLQATAFDRKRPAKDRLPELRRFSDLAKKTGNSYVVTFHWTEDPRDPGLTVDLIQDEIDRVEFDLKLAALLASRR